jgi:hypothetical protein
MDPKKMEENIIFSYTEEERKYGVIKDFQFQWKLDRIELLLKELVLVHAWLKGGLHPRSGNFESTIETSDELHSHFEDIFLYSKEKEQKRLCNKVK